MSHRIDGYMFETSITARWKGMSIRGHFMNYGVGYVVGGFEMPDLGISLNSLGCFTQVEPLKWRLVLANRLCIARVSRWPRALRPAVYAVLAAPANLWLSRFVEPDYPIWEGKSFLRRPRLTAGDKDLIAHRRWASQFYPGGLVDDLNSASRPSPPPS